MTKRKVILLPDDDRILDLYKGNIGGPEKTDQDEETVHKQPVTNRDERLWYQVLIEKTVLVALIPFLFLALVVMIPTVLIGHLVLGKKGDAFQEKCFEWLSVFHDLVPYRKRIVSNWKRELWKGVEEDVPGMLEGIK